MLNVTGSSPSPGFVGIGASTAGLEARLGRYQKELSNSVNCASANTRQGRETIQALSNKISVVKTQIEEISGTKQNTQPNTTRPVNAIIETAAPAAGVSTAMVGSRLDIFA